MFEFSFEVSGDIQVKRLFSRFGNKINDLVPALKNIRKRYYDVEKKQFASQGGFGSGGWEALSETYRVRKAKLYPGKGILEASGDMKRSLTVPGSYGNVDILEHDSLVLGTNLDYPVYHQHGTGHMPKRKPIELPEAEKRAWTSILHKHIFVNR